jgi:Domain of unknown function (DUF4476)
MDRVNQNKRFTSYHPKETLMRGLLSLAALLAGTLATEAQSMLRIATTDSTPINVSVDGRHYMKYNKTLTVGDIPPGAHYVKVFAAREPEEDRGSIYEGTIKTFDDKMTRLTVNPTTGETLILVDTESVARMGYTQHREHRGCGDKQYGEHPHWQHHHHKDNGYGDVSGSYKDEYHTPPPTGEPLSQIKMDKLKAKVDKENNESDKLAKMEKHLRKHSLTTAQVGDMMGWLRSESDKVQFAEDMYNHTVDRQAYNTLEAKLMYNDSKAQLEQFVKTK